MKPNTHKNPGLEFPRTRKRTKADQDENETVLFFWDDDDRPPKPKWVPIKDLIAWVRKEEEGNSWL